MHKLKLLGISAAMMLAASSGAEARNNIVFVIDSSGSMWGQLNGIAKMTTAKTVLPRLLGDLPPTTNVGIMAYGHRFKGSCQDVEVMAHIGPRNPYITNAAVNRLTPLGKTPIAYALGQTAGMFRYTAPGDTNHIVLISDGIETCGGDPCAVAGWLAQQNIHVKVHVVGFDIAPKDRAQLQCIAANGRGYYFPANSTSGFRYAVQEAVRVATAPPPPPPPPPAPVVKAPPPPPPPPAPVVKTAPPPPPPPAPIAAPPKPALLFFDDFKGDALAAHWTVQNPDKDAYLVENGELLSIASGGAALEKGDVVNLFKLNTPLPKGDWVATIKFRMPYQTGRETPFLALYDNKDNHLAVMSNAWSYYEHTRGSRLYLTAQKLLKGKKTSFNKVIWGGASGKPFKMTEVPNPFILRLTKKGRSYYPAVGINAGGEMTWTQHDKISMLRAKGNLAFGIYQSRKVKGETPLYVDWVKIESLPQ